MNAFNRLNIVPRRQILLHFMTIENKTFLKAFKDRYFMLLCRENKFKYLYFLSQKINPPKKLIFTTPSPIQFEAFQNIYSVSKENVDFLNTKYNINEATSSLDTLHIKITQHYLEDGIYVSVT